MRELGISAKRERQRRKLELLKQDVIQEAFLMYLHAQFSFRSLLLK